MSGSGGMRGYPLVALLAVLGGWVGGRYVTGPVEAVSFDVHNQPTDGSLALAEVGYLPNSYAGPQSYAGSQPYASEGAGESDHVYPIEGVLGAPRSVYWRQQVMPSVGWARGRAALPEPHKAVGFAPTHRSLPDNRPQLLKHLLAEFAQFKSAPAFYAPELPRKAEGHSAAANPVAFQVAPSFKSHRWSGDFWALMRKNQMGTLPSPGLMPATYGGSQAGGVLRYHPKFAVNRRPAIFVRSTASTGLIKESALAAGITARPIPTIPITAGIEARVVDQKGKRRFQPAVMAVTELPPFKLTSQWRGELYAQGGYVAGTFGTPFADGQFKVDRPLFAVERYKVRVGGGIWAGAQKGAHRVDVGPTASLAMPMGKRTMGRLSADWRFRVAGNAIPDSGPAMTLTAGF